MDDSPMNKLTDDTLHMIFANLPLRQIGVSRSICKSLNQTLTSATFLHLVAASQPPLSLLALRPPHHHHHHQRLASSPAPPALHAFDPSSNNWLKFDLTFLPFRSIAPVTSSLGLVYLWGESPESNKSLVVCNPLNRRFRILPPLGSAWSKHGSVLTGSGNRVLVLTELATLYFTGSNSWLKFSSNLPSKPRSPVLIRDSLYSLCDVGSPWRNQWKLFTCTLPESRKSLSWSRVEKLEWGDVFDILKRPRLIKGLGNNLLMIGGLKSSFSLNATCSTIVILRLDLDTLEWHEAARMPVEIYKCFQESNKFKVFGGGDRVCFSAKRVGKLALCYCPVEEAPDGVWRGLRFGVMVTNFAKLLLWRAKGLSEVLVTQFNSRDRQSILLVSEWRMNEGSHYLVHSTYQEEKIADQLNVVEKAKKRLSIMLRKYFLHSSMIQNAMWLTSSYALLVFMYGYLMAKI